MTGIICAMDVEYQAIKSSYSASEEEHWGDDTSLCHCPGGILLAKSGIGKAAAYAAASRLLERYAPVTYVWSVGIAGAVSPDIGIGDIIAANAIVDYGDDRAAEEWPIPCAALPWGALGDKLRMGKVLCGDDVLDDAAKRDRLYRRHQPLCVDMESAGVWRACRDKAVPFAALKCISDHADNRALRSMLRNQFKAADRLAAALIKLTDMMELNRKEPV